MPGGSDSLPVSFAAALPGDAEELSAEEAASFARLSEEEDRAEASEEIPSLKDTGGGSERDSDAARAGPVCEEEAGMFAWFRRKRPRQPQ